MSEFGRGIAKAGLKLNKTAKVEISYRISQLAQNAVDSLAIKSGRNPNSLGRISTELHVGERYLAVRVEDNGAGIDSVVAPHLFTWLMDKPIPNSRRKQAVAARLNVRVAGGMGMGLEQIKEYAEKLGGKVFHFNKGPELGAIFGFTIPLSSITAPISDVTSATSGHKNTTP